MYINVSCLVNYIFDFYPDYISDSFLLHKYMGLI